MYQEYSALDKIQVQLLIKIHKHNYLSVTELIRDLKLGGETYYRHKEALIDWGLVREVVRRNSKVRTVKLELTKKGSQVTILLEELSTMLSETQSVENSAIEPT